MLNVMNLTVNGESSNAFVLFDTTIVANVDHLALNMTFDSDVPYMTLFNPITSSEAVYVLKSLELVFNMNIEGYEPVALIISHFEGKSLTVDGLKISGTLNIECCKFGLISHEVIGSTVFKNVVIEGEITTKSGFATLIYTGVYQVIVDNLTLDLIFTPETEEMSGLLFGEGLAGSSFKINNVNILGSYVIAFANFGFLINTDSSSSVSFVNININPTQLSL